MLNTIVDQFGSEAVWSGGAYQAPRDEAGLRVSHPNMYSDWSAMLPRGRYIEAVSDCRWIANAFGLVSGAIEQRADYVCASGLRPMFEGEDDTWGEEAEQAIEEADKVAGVRGLRFTTKENFRLIVKAFATDGAAFIVPTESAGGFPQMQVIEAHRVGSRDSTKEFVESGRFKGLRILNGIIYANSGLEVAYNVLGRDTKGKDDVQLDTSQMWHIARPKWISENRPPPEIAPAILDLWDIREGRESAKMQLIIDGRLTMIESNATGKADPSRSAMAPPRTASGAQTEVIEKGAIRYVKNGNTLTPWSANRPSDQWQRFDTRIISTAMYAMGWRAEMFDLSSLGGSTTRAFQDQINTCIYSTYNAILPYINLWRQYQVAKLIKIGRLRPSNEWYKWGCTPPPEFTCDPSRSVSSDISATRAGYTSVPIVQGTYGYRPKQVLRSQSRWLKMRADEAKRAGVNEYELGLQSTPGDAIQQQITADAESTNMDSNNGSDSGSSEEAKFNFNEFVDMYGVGVRAGIITPNEKDEEYIRMKIGMPALNEDIRAAWNQDGRTRKPITLQGQKQALSDSGVDVNSKEFGTK